jgi:pyruvate,water dikinase
MGNFAKSLHEISANDMNEVGRKAAGLGDLARAGFNIPAGYSLLRHSYSCLEDHNRLQPKIDVILSEMNYEDLGSIERKTSDIRNLITSSKFPPDLESNISNVISCLGAHAQRFLAVRALFVSGANHLSLTSDITGPFYYLKGKKAVSQHARICWSSYWSQSSAKSLLSKGGSRSGT